MGKDIDTIRSLIDALDDELIELLRKRFELCGDGPAKGRTEREIFDPAREEAIWNGSPRRPAPLSQAMIESVFARIFSISRTLQKRRTVAYLGPEGSYSHQAAVLLFGDGDELLAQRDLDAVVNEVATGRSDLGVVPVENSIEGMVNRTLDLMATSRLFVNREIMLPIRNCLLSLSARENVRVVYSHPQALAQCRKWLAHNLPSAEIRETPSTSEAAVAARSDEHGAAVASALTARIYGLNVIAENINDASGNLTRFWVISPVMTAAGENAKTSIIITLKNHPGSLHRALGVFADKGINLTKIESRPSKQTWEYIFFIDFQGGLEDKNVERAMEELRTTPLTSSCSGHTLKGEGFREQAQMRPMDPRDPAYVRAPPRTPSPDATGSRTPSSSPPTKIPGTEPHGGSGHGVRLPACTSTPTRMPPSSGRRPRPSSGATQGRSLQATAPTRSSTSCAGRSSRRGPR